MNQRLHKFFFTSPIGIMLFACGGGGGGAYVATEVVESTAQLFAGVLLTVMQ